MQKVDLGMYVFIILTLAFLVLLFLAKILEFVGEFRVELRCLNSNIQRTVGKEKVYWIRQRRRLWLSLLPFVKY